MLDARLLTDLAALLSELALATRTEDGRALVLDDRLREAIDALDLHGATLKLEDAARRTAVLARVFGSGGVL
jgi:hypothetical protein